MDLFAFMASRTDCLSNHNLIFVADAIGQLPSAVATYICLKANYQRAFACEANQARRLFCTGTREGGPPQQRQLLPAMVNS
ncbi:MAG: hypothetical protein JXQ99_04620 [Hyphomicrobiaceae bacterium]